ncbi:hypothetical protein MHAS_02034 [Mycolicibacterium hassiacum DSM 44199]|jgi:hypothetical protein|nr:DUF4190 domain-containing protein [Mycolicibacterium hassiacum]PZN23162.1 MAG: DUF4190 domain-containing protein [Mycolicibacterium hassiacum]VCT90329.1 hypothetical protein MHAS_02034 [Mycolicibacterium hassiacum DSM 44199]
MSEPETPAGPSGQAPLPGAPPTYAGYPPPGYPGGYPTGYPAAPPPPAPAGPRNGIGLAALLTGIVGALTLYGGVVLGPAAVVLGIIGWNRVRRGEATNGPVALLGIVLGAVGLIVGVIAIVLTVMLMNEVGAGDYFDCMSSAGGDPDAVDACLREFTDRIEEAFPDR